MTEKDAITGLEIMRTCCKEQNQIEMLNLAIAALEMQIKMQEYCLGRICKKCDCWNKKSEMCLNDFMIDS